MAKKGKRLPAAQRLKISEGVKKARAARLAASKPTAITVKGWELSEPMGGGGGSTPRSSKEYASASERLAIDIVALIVHDNVEPTTVVRVVERILRP